VTFREHIREFNKNSAHCHVLHSDLKPGIPYCDVKSNEHPGVAHFWNTLETSPDQVLGALSLSDLRKPAKTLPCRVYSRHSTRPNSSFLRRTARIIV
jgi:hypothetical protein